MPAFKERFNIASQSEHEYANTKGWIVSIATAGAVFGCLMVCPLPLIRIWFTNIAQCSWMNSRFGRKKTLFLYTIIYIAGVFGQTFSNGSLTALYIARIISGFGIGGTTVVPSIYLSEVRDKLGLRQEISNAHRLLQGQSEV